MGHFWQDFRFGIRMLCKHPTLSITAVLTFSLGIGLTTTVFSVVNGAMYKGLPFEEADRIVAVFNFNPASNIRRAPISVHDYAVWQERQTVFETMVRGEPSPSICPGVKDVRSVTLPAL